MALLVTVRINNMAKQSTLPDIEYELEIVLMSGEIIQRRFSTKDLAMKNGHYCHDSGLWIADRSSSLVFVPSHRIRKMAIHEKKPLSL